jgi:hypothetical protein
VDPALRLVFRLVVGVDWLLNSPQDSVLHFHTHDKRIRAWVFGHQYRLLRLLLDNPEQNAQATI